MFINLRNYGIMRLEINRLNKLSVRKKPSCVREELSVVDIQVKQRKGHLLLEFAEGAFLASAE